MKIGLLFHSTTKSLQNRFFRRKDTKIPVTAAALESDKKNKNTVQSSRNFPGIFLRIVKIGSMRH